MLVEMEAKETHTTRKKKITFTSFRRPKLALFPFIPCIKYSFIGRVRISMWKTFSMEFEQEGSSV